MQGEPLSDGWGSWRIAALASILVLALILRLKDPLLDPVIAAEDPYLHMVRAWDLVQHQQLPKSYPPGFAFLTAPLALAGTEALYWGVRLAPPLLGVIGVAGVYLLLRERLRETAALAGALATAVLPEHIFRTTLFAPTALDLALLPFLLLFMLRAVDGSRSALLAALGLASALLVIHPWALGLVLPAATVWGLLQLPREHRIRALMGGLGLVGVVLVTVVFLPGAWNPVPRMSRNLGTTLARIVQDPASLMTLPPFVDLPVMLTPALIVSGILGSIVAGIRRDSLDQLALLWTVSLTPLVLVNWFDIWFLPHRTVAYLSLGVAMLTGVAADELLERLPEAPRVRRPSIAAVALALMLFTVPAAAASQTWYRLYGPEDYSVWREVANEDPSLVVAGSWETRRGYRAITGQEAMFLPAFSHDAEVREDVLEEHPDLVVLVGAHAQGAWRPTGFLDSDEWVLVHEQGPARAYKAAETAG